MYHFSTFVVLLCVNKNNIIIILINYSYYFIFIYFILKVYILIKVTYIRIKQYTNSMTNI